MYQNCTPILDFMIKWSKRIDIGIYVAIIFSYTCSIKHYMQDAVKIKHCPFGLFVDYPPLNFKGLKRYGDNRVISQFQETTKYYVFTFFLIALK